MPVEKDPSGRRSVHAEAEVPGTPEQVWQAIANGPGISSWFVPSEVEAREGGTTVSHFGADSSMDAVAKITEWSPPHRFVAESNDDPNLGPVATEWIVEARDGGTCTVRVVHSWFASTDDWDAQFEGHTYGWAGFFKILRLYLAHFAGQPCTLVQLHGIAPEPVPDAWTALVEPLGLTGAQAGQSMQAPADAPLLAGIVEEAGPPEFPSLLVRTSEPAPGIAHLFAMPMGGTIYLSIRLFLYGASASAAGAQAEPIWQAWLADRFPAPAAS